MAEAWAVEVEQRVGGSPEAVFAYFVEPEKHRRWHGTDVEIDPRVGGSYRISYAPGVWVSGEYVAIEPPDRLVMTWGFESEIPLPRGLTQVPAGSSTVEFRFAPDGDGTIIRVRHLGLPSRVAQDAHTLGWDTYLPRLAELVAGSDPGPDPTLEIGRTLLARDEAAMVRNPLSR